MSFTVKILSGFLITVESINSAFLFVLNNFIPLTSLLIISKTNVIPFSTDINSRKAFSLHFSSAKRLDSRALLLEISTNRNEFFAFVDSFILEIH